MKSETAVEKVVESLFLHLLYQANPNRTFAYAALDGDAESAYGDAVAITHKVFVFEFKRSLQSVAGELGKFNCKDSSSFLKLLLEHAHDYEEHLKKWSGIPQGHFLVALPQMEESKKTIILKTTSCDNLTIGSYLVRLTNTKEKLPVSEHFKRSIIGLEDVFGFDLEFAKKYFFTLVSLKNNSGKGVAQTASFACTFLSSSGEVSITWCDSIDQVNDLVQQHKNAKDKILQKQTTQPQEQSSEYPEPRMTM
jgi:hypothetical protein